MARADFTNVLKIFQGGEPSPEEKQELFKEVLLMTLARATSADTNTKVVEVEAVQRVLGEVLGENVEATEIRVAAKSEAFEKTPLEKYLVKVGHKLDDKDRAVIIKSLTEVIRSDVRISPFEIEYFNMVSDALGATPAELVGLSSDSTS
ncbi:MAG: TerB family tellurite resistance protein [Gammaproteobacteria bacterium]|nr:TerB family tellurite resistance protein [Gammaproteobacteria bacterium]